MSHVGDNDLISVTIIVTEHDNPNGVEQGQDALELDMRHNSRHVRQLVRCITN